MYEVIHRDKLYQKFQKKLIGEGLISVQDNIKIEIIYRTQLNGINIYHYLVKSSLNQKKFLIKTIKEKDYSYAVMDNLNQLNEAFPLHQYPRVLAKPFSIDQHTYVITSYLEGKELSTLITALSEEDLLRISELLDVKLKCIHTITSEQYSEGHQFSDNSFATIMSNKIYNQLYNNNYYIKQLIGNRDINSLLTTANDILYNSKFSEPTFIHMDVKPENIIISSSGDVHLIDFELSRFGDLEYEWSNILIKTLHLDREKFNRYVLNPIIEKNFLVLDEAIKIDKYKVYLLYLSMNAYIHCFKYNKKCSHNITELIDTILNQLTKMF